MGLSLSFSLSLLASPASPETSELQWNTDLTAALQKAKAEHRRVLLNFTRSDSCPSCARLKKQVFTTPEFARYAAEKLVLVVVDFPEKKPQPDALKRANAALKDRFLVAAFPTVILLNAEGGELGRHLGIVPGNVSSFLKKIENFNK